MNSDKLGFPGTIAPQDGDAISGLNRRELLRLGSLSVMGLPFSRYARAAQASFSCMIAGAGMAGLSAALRLHVAGGARSSGRAGVVVPVS